MHCREARNRLNGLTGNGRPDLEDSELQKHLAECPECAKYAEATGLLAKMFEAAAENDTIGAIPQQSMQKLVETRLSVRRSVPQRMWWALWHRPRYGLGLVVTAAVLALVSLVPFGYDRIVGYNLAVDGVSKELAENDHVICDAFYQLGVFDAGVDVTACDTTCQLLIFDLRSSEEVRKAKAALNRLGESSVTTDVIPVTARSSASLLAQANQKIFTN